MAAFAQPSHPASSSAPRLSQQSVASRILPTGPCHYKDIAAGKDSVQCGCRQFWLNDAAIATPGPPAAWTLAPGAWCYCGHHGCFHEHKDARSSTAAAAGQQDIDGAVGSGANVLSLDLPRLPSFRHGQIIEHGTSLRQHGFQDQDYHVDLPSFGRTGLGLFGSGNRPPLAGTPPLERQLNPQNASADHLPSTQCSVAGHSGAASVVGERRRSSPATVHTPRPSQVTTSAAAAENRTQSATEMATPSLAGTPALKDTDEGFQNLRTTLEAFNKRHATLETVPTAPLTAEAQNPSRAVPRQSGPDSDPETGLSAKILKEVGLLRAILSSTPNLVTSLKSLNARLEALEAMSFSHLDAEDVYDRFENFDGRVLDVECKLSDLEKATATVIQDRQTGRGHQDGANASFGSDHSYNSGINEGTSHMARLDAISEQLSSHHQRLTGLEAIAPPTVAHPWEIELVYIPFGRDLKGLWSPNSNVAQMSMLPTQMSASRGQNTPPSSANYGAAKMDWRSSIEDTLVARACGPSNGAAGRIYERLKSRGFVRKISLVSNTASHVSSVICSAFGPRLPHRSPGGNPGVQGLHHPFIPLRKIHRSPALRLLTDSELVSPTFWTAEFLEASVFMHARSSGLRRLYVTEPNGYRQPQSDGSSLSWSKIREMPRFAETVEGEVGEADALEPCWTFDDWLDPPVKAIVSFSSGLSYHSSFDSHMLSPRQTNPPSEEQGSQSDGERLLREQGAFDLGSGSSRSSPKAQYLSTVPLAPPHLTRSASMPSQAEASCLNTAVNKRQVSSFDHVSPVKDLPKRRRVSRSSDDVEVMGLWSPRRSREPPSPRSSRMSRRASLSRGASSKQASTSEPQLAYATPYSVDIVRGPDGGMEAEMPYVGDSDMQDADAESSADEYMPGGSDDEDHEDMMKEEEHDLMADAVSDLGAMSQLESDDNDIDGRSEDGEGWEGTDEEEDAAHDDDDSEPDMGPEAQRSSDRLLPHEEDELGK